MANKPANPFKFWEELRRRKVIKVIVGYLAAAYVILELTTMIVEPLGLPGWTTKLVIILLCLGFGFTAVISWIYDLTDGGVVKTGPAKKEKGKQPSVINRRKLKGSDIIIAVLFVAVAILAYPKVFRKDIFKDIRDDDGRISVAVMPFQNVTNDTIWDIWQSGIQFSLISYLSNSAELKVRKPENINTIIKSEGLTNFASLTPNIARRASQKLDAKIFIYGNVMPAGPNVRINAQLIDSKTEEAFKSFEIDGPADEYLFFHMIDSLKRLVKDFLIISELRKESPLYDHISISGQSEMSSTDSPEAIRYNIQGLKAFYDTDYHTAERFFLEAIAIDSNLIEAITYLSLSYMNRGLSAQGKLWCLKAYAKRDQMSMYQKFFVNWLYAVNFETRYEAIIWLKQILQYDDQQPGWYYVLGNTYRHLKQYDNAILALERALEIYDKWGIKPLWVPNYSALGEAYHKTGNFNKEKKLYERAEQDFPDNTSILQLQAILSLSEGDTVAAKQYIDKYISIRKDNSNPEVNIVIGLAIMYSEAEILDKAEEYYRKALSLKPENPVIMNHLAYFLIDKDRNTNAGLDLINTALGFDPDDYNYLQTKGWGLYKQGNYEEALEILERSWELRRENAIYNHGAYLHLEAAKKAVANIFSHI